MWSALGIAGFAQDQPAAPAGLPKSQFDALLAAQQQQGGGGGLLGNLLFGQKGFMGMFPQSVQENGLVGSLVNRLTAPSTRSGYADAATSRTASVAHAARRGAATVISAPANGQHGEQRS